MSNLKFYSKVLSSKLAISEENVQNIQLREIHDLSVGQTVDVTGKVVTVFPPKEINTKADKQLKLQMIHIGNAKD